MRADATVGASLGRTTAKPHRGGEHVCRVAERPPGHRDAGSARRVAARTSAPRTRLRTTSGCARSATSAGPPGTPARAAGPRASSPRTGPVPRRRRHTSPPCRTARRRDLRRAGRPARGTAPRSSGSAGPYCSVDKRAAPDAGDLLPAAQEREVVRCHADDGRLRWPRRRRPERASVREAVRPCPRPAGREWFAAALGAALCITGRRGRALWTSGAGGRSPTRHTCSPGR